MSGSFIQAPQRKPWEKHVQANEKSTFLAQDALPSLTLVPSSPHYDRFGLPTVASGGNISPESPVIRWMSAQGGASTLGRRPILHHRDSRRGAVALRRIARILSDALSAAKTAS